MAENMQDAARKGRLGVPGQDNHNAKLCDADVHEIQRLRAEGQTQQAIADHFSISQSLVSLVVRGRAWRHMAVTS
jgi:DNA invertase Pin-like site-specific DNA recombinase